MGMCKRCNQVVSVLEMKDGYCEECLKKIKNKEEEEENKKATDGFLTKNKVYQSILSNDTIFIIDLLIESLDMILINNRFSKMSKKEFMCKEVTKLILAYYSENSKKEDFFQCYNNYLDMKSLSQELKIQFNIVFNSNVAFKKMLHLNIELYQSHLIIGTSIYEVIQTMIPIEEEDDNEHKDDTLIGTTIYAVLILIAGIITKKTAYNKITLDNEKTNGKKDFFTILQNVSNNSIESDVVIDNISNIYNHLYAKYHELSKFDIYIYIGSVQNSVSARYNKKIKVDKDE